MRVATRRATLVAAAVGLIVLTACGSGGSDQSSDEAGRSAAEAQAGGAAPTAEPAQAADATTAVTVATQDATLLIRTASLQVRTDDVRDAVRSIEDLAAAFQGTVTTAAVSAADGDDPSDERASVTMRVPEERFREALRSVADLGEVLDQREDAQDVTTEVVDVDARVKSQQASVERVRALLAKATTIGEVVSVEAELARREADLDALLSRQAVLADQTARATITVELVGPEAEVAPPVEQRGFLYGLEQGWSAFVTSGAVLLTMLGAVLPFAALVALALSVTLLSLRARGRRSA